MLTTSFIGYCYEKDSAGNCIINSNNDTYYQAYFKQIDNNSETSGWMATPNLVSDEGYFSLSLEDFAFLNIGSIYKKGVDKIYICFWKGDSNRSSDLLTHATVIEVEFENDVTRLDVYLEPVRTPIITNYAFPISHNTSIDYIMYENSISNSEIVVSDCGVSTYPQNQLNTLEGIMIFDGHRLDKTLYDWGDGFVEYLPPNSSSSYMYKIAGEYTQRIRVYETWHTYTEKSQSVMVTYNKPILDFTYTPEFIKGKSLVTITNTSTDLDNRCVDNYIFDWSIQDSKLDNTDNTKVYLTKQNTFCPVISFQSPGEKTIMLKCYWNDGFSNQVETLTKTIVVNEYDINVDFDIDKMPESRDDTVTFTNTTTDIDNKIISCSWYIEDKFAKSNPNNPEYGMNETDNSHLSIDVDKNFSEIWNFQSVEPSDVTLEITYDTGFETKVKEITKTVEKYKYVLSAEFKLIEPYVSYNPVHFVNTTLDTYNRQLPNSEHWVFDDKDLINSSNITERYNQPLYDEQQFVFKFASRKPYSAVNGSTESNKNKFVRLSITYDDGWENTIKSKCENYYEASPAEIDATIVITPVL